MKKMIIIDDERLIRNGLLDYLNWQSLGIEIVALCANGQEGLNAIHTYDPDLVLSDISMPLMDGVQLLKTIRMEGYQHTAFIFISSYSEFRYAQEAVKYNAFEYLLKPLEAPVLEDCVRRCLADQAGKAIDTQTDGIDWSLARELLKSVLYGTVDAEEALSAMLTKAGISHPEAQLLIGLGSEAAGQYRFADNTLYCQLENDCIAVLIQKGTYAGGSLDDPEYVWQLTDIRTSVHDAFCRALLERWIRDHSLQRTDVTDILDPTYWSSRLVQIARDFLKKENICYSECWQMLWNELQKYCQQLDRIRIREMPEQTPDISRMIDHKQVYSMFDAAEKIGRELSGFLADNAAISPYTMRVLNLIAEEYANDLALDIIAKKIGISKSYLSSTFKTDMNCTFGDYLFAYRMKKAKALLESGEYKVTEIGEMVGYPDIASFSKRFKQYYAVSPRRMLKKMKE